jgi:hypothetical protein
VAAFLTHLVVGERVFAAEDGGDPAAEGYGLFLFGCLAPDVDKLCDGLDQGVTHFVAKGEEPDWMWQRSRRFLNHQVDFLRAPFHELEMEERAFVRGYLCHVATDEITGRLAQRLRSQLAATGTPLPDVNALLTVMDPRCWALAVDPGELVAALATTSIPADSFPFLSGRCLSALHEIVLPQVQQGGGPIPYLSMVRRQGQWKRHGHVSDAADDPELEAELAVLRQRVEANLQAAEAVVNQMDLGVFVEEAVDHSCQCVEALVRGKGVE